MARMFPSYDDWRSTDPADSMPEDRPRPTPMAHCEHCASTLADFSVVRCSGCGAWSYYPARPERRRL
jgi:hypothetical protein